MPNSKNLFFEEDDTDLIPGKLVISFDSGFGEYYYYIVAVGPIEDEEY